MKLSEQFWIKHFWVRARNAALIEARDWWNRKLKFTGQEEMAYWTRKTKDQRESEIWWKAEVRAVARKIFGKVPYNSFSEDLGGFREVIKPGAFTETIEEDKNVYFLWAHDHAKPLGSTASGTLRLDDKSDGLHFELDPPDNTAGRDALMSVRRGDVQKISFGFNVKEGGERWREIQGQPIRELTNVELYELSAVVWPAYVEGWIKARDLNNNKAKQVLRIR